jgi:dolichyl-diphosphooligosaccharide--protein glycosyltransferase
VDWTIEDVRGQQVRMSNGSRRFNSMEAAREYVSSDPTSQIGGIGQYPEERVPALEHYRMVDGSETRAIESRAYQFSLQKEAAGGLRASLRSPGVLNALQPRSDNWVKTFERVPGATIEGEGPANTTVTAAVQMEVPSTNSTFVYRQQTQTDDDGTFTMTVPYSTTGYDEWGTREGYTDPSVRANTSYQLRTGVQTNESHAFRYQGSVDVAEGQVIGENESVSRVTLEKGPARSTEVNEIDSNETNGDETSGNETTTDDSTATPTPDSSDGSTATPTDTGTATPTAEAGTATPTSSSTLVPPSAAGPVTIVALFGAGLVSLVTLSKRD